MVSFSPLRTTMLLAAAGLLAACAAPSVSVGVTLDPDGTAAPTASAQPAQPAPEPVRYRGPVEHIFFHPLMVHPKVALTSGQAQGYNEFFVTVREFERMLPALYDNDWVLVDIESLVTETTNAAGQTVLRKAPLMLPAGKKPLVISIDDLNYYPYMIADQLNHRLVLDADGNVAAEHVERGRTVVSRDTEIVPILDRFVEEHPDFSVDGAKGVIALTGFDGILGYRTSGDNATNPKQARAEVAPVVERLRATGWSFASHSYGHPDFARISDGYAQVDTDDWERNVDPLLGGDTKVFVFPYGASVQPGTAKFRSLQRAGFTIFCPISPTARLEVGKDYAIQDRVHVDGISLLSQQSTLARFFDADAIADPVRPPLTTAG